MIRAMCPVMHHIGMMCSLGASPSSHFPRESSGISRCGAGRSGPGRSGQAETAFAEAAFAEAVAVLTTGGRGGSA